MGSYKKGIKTKKSDSDSYESYGDSGDDSESSGNNHSSSYGDEEDDDDSGSHDSDKEEGP